MSDNDDKVQVTFLPGCFDGFDGTQEELDNMIAKIMTKLNQLVGEDGLKIDPTTVRFLTMSELDQLDQEDHDLIKQTMEHAEQQGIVPNRQDKKVH